MLRRSRSYCDEPSSIDRRTDVRYRDAVAKQLTVSDVITMRQSLGMAPNLPTNQVRHLLDEAERLLRAHAEIEAVVVRMRAPFGDVRTNLNDLAKLVGRE